MNDKGEFLSTGIVILRCTGCNGYDHIYDNCPNYKDSPVPHEEFVRVESAKTVNELSQLTSSDVPLEPPGLSKASNPLPRNGCANSTDHSSNSSNPTIYTNTSIEGNNQFTDMSSSSDNGSMVITCRNDDQSFPCNPPNCSPIDDEDD